MSKQQETNKIITNIWKKWKQNEKLGRILEQEI